MVRAVRMKRDEQVTVDLQRKSDYVQRMGMMKVGMMLVYGLGS